MLETSGECGTNTHEQQTKEKNNIVILKDFVWKNTIIALALIAVPKFRKKAETKVLELVPVFLFKEDFA